MRSRSWPFLTVSPRRARTSTTRPEARVTTGTVRETSGYTDPVTTNFDGASYCAAVATGYRSGWSTEKWVTSRPGTTVAEGGASAAALSFDWQPVIRRAATTSGHTFRMLHSCISASADNPTQILFPFSGEHTPRVRARYRA